MSLRDNRTTRRVLAVLLPVLVLAASGLGAAVLIQSRPETPHQAREQNIPAVRVIEAAAEDVILTVTTQGTVEPRRQMTLVPQVSGRVIEVSPSFAAGGFFEAEEVLVRIDPRDYDLAIVRAQARLAEAELKLRQEEAAAEQAKREWSELGRGEPTALAARQPQMAEARAWLAAAEADLAESRLNRERTEIRAPFAGRVREKKVDLGQFVSPGVTLATLYSVDYAEVRLPLSDGDLRFVDLPLSFRGEEVLDHQPAVKLRAVFAGRKHEWTGRIVRTEGTIDPGSRMLYAVAQVDNPYARDESVPDRPPLKVGMFVEAEIEGRPAERAVVLPRGAVRANDEVLVVDPEDRLRVRRVEVLRSDRDRVIVSSGVEPGERVSVSVLETVVEGMRVRPVTDVVLIDD
jgi:membrane fusion protein, multidrug efflux system